MRGLGGTMKYQYAINTNRCFLKNRQINRKHKPTVSLSLILIFTSMVFAFQNAYAAPVSYTFNTSLLLGTSATLDFSFFDGDQTANNAVTISNFSGGTLINSICYPLVSCTPHPVDPSYVIDDSLAFGQFLQNLILGTSLSFDLDSSANFTGGNTDRLVVSLLDATTQLTLVNTNLDQLNDSIPYDNALLLMDLGQDTITVQQADIGPKDIPEPNTLLLILVGLQIVVIGKLR